MNADEPTAAPVDWAALDPGRRWRRLARWGALLTALATIVPIDSPQRTLWHATGEIYEELMEKRNDAPFELLVFFCLFAPAMLVGPLNLILWGRVTLKSRSLRLFLATALLLVTAATIYYFVMRRLHIEVIEEHTAIVAGSALSFFLLICGLALSTARHVERMPTAIFCLGVVPLFTASGAWAVFACIVFWWEQGTPMSIISFMSCTGCALMCIGFFGWWAAVRRAVRGAWPRRLMNNEK